MAESEVHDIQWGVELFDTRKAARAVWRQDRSPSNVRIVKAHGKFVLEKKATGARLCTDGGWK